MRTLGSEGDRANLGKEKGAVCCGCSSHNEFFHSGFEIKQIASIIRSHSFPLGEWKGLVIIHRI